QRGAAAAPRRRRPRACHRPPDRPGQRARAAAGTGRDLHRRDPVAGPRRLLPDLAGRRLVVSAGGTREEIDPVRFIGNWSTGPQGYALASTAAARGAEVIVVAASVALPDPAGVKVTRVVSAREMQDAVRAAAAGADAVVMAAAVADYRPAARSPAKIKKDGRPPAPIGVTANPDILAGLAAARRAQQATRSAHDPERAGLVPHPLLVGFAAETDTSPE